MHMHSYLSGNYLIVGFDIGSWSQNGWPLASGLLKSGRQHSGCSIEAARYCYQSMLHAQTLVQEHLRISSLTCPPGDAFTQTLQLFGRMQLRAYTVQHVTSLLTLGRDPHGSPLLCSCSSHFLTVFLCLLYYLLTITHTVAQSATVYCSPQ